MRLGRDLKDDPPLIGRRYAALESLHNIQGERPCGDRFREFVVNEQLPGAVFFMGFLAVAKSRRLSVLCGKAQACGFESVAAPDFLVVIAAALPVVAA